MMTRIGALSLALALTVTLPAHGALDVAGTYTVSGKDTQSTIVIRRLEDGRFAFSAEATNDRLLHDGSYEGVFQLKGNIAHFRDQGDHDGCDLVFVFRDDKLLVTQNPEYGNCDCGAGVSFDGLYQRLQHPSRDRAKRPAGAKAIPTDGVRPNP